MDNKDRFMPILLFTLTLALYIHGSDINFCPRTWTKIDYHCYKFGNETLDFFAARKVCLDKRADLAAFRYEGLLHQLQKEVPHHFLNATRQEFWIGLQQRQISPGTSAWKWTDGTPPNFFLENYFPLRGNGSAVWMDKNGFGISQVNETKGYICQRNMMIQEKMYCSYSICVRLQNYGNNRSGASSKEQCLKKGSDIPIIGAKDALWRYLRRLMGMYGMDQPVWVQGTNGTYECWNSVFDNRTCNGTGRTVCIKDYFGTFLVPQCPCHWNEWNDTCDYVSGKKLESRNYAAALNYCRMTTHTSRLATINTLEDFNYYKRTTAYQHNGMRTYWIGKGNFAPTIQTGEQCLVLNLTYNKGVVTKASIVEENCLKKHRFICQKKLQTYFPESVCEEGTFKRVCYHRHEYLNRSSEVVCDEGEQLTAKMLKVYGHNIKAQPAYSGPVWNLTGTTGCLAHWIKDGNDYRQLQPQKSYSKFLLLQSFDKTRKVPFICVTEHLLLSTKCGIAVAILLFVGFTTFLVTFWLRRRRLKKTEVYSECRPLLPPRNGTSDVAEINFQQNAMYAPFRN